MIKSGPTGSFRGYLNIRAGPPTEKLNFCTVGKFPKCRLLILADRKINIKCSSQIFIILQPYVDPCWSVSFSSHMLIRASHSASAQKWPAGSTTGVTCVSSSNFSVTMMMTMMAMTMMVMVINGDDDDVNDNLNRSLRLWLPEGEQLPPIPTGTGPWIKHNI